ncbi:MAG: type II toxin-antitoxin system VapB family antitoxin [Roseiarcus sp.]
MGVRHGSLAQLGRMGRGESGTTPLQNATFRGDPCRIDVTLLSSIRMKTEASMLQIRNRRVVDLAAKLAAIRRSTKTDAVLSALENELARIEGEKSLAERLKPLQERIAKWPSTGLKADKAFFDDLSGEE